MVSAPRRASHHHLLLLLPVLLSYLLHRAAAQPATAPDEKQLLLQIKRAWGDPPVLAAWDGKGDHCTWPYVACDASSGRVANLSLANTYVAGPVSDAVGGLSGLTSLDLYNNSINGTFPTSLYRCASLRYLDLSENYLSGELPADIGTGLGKNLTYLILRGNGFTGFVETLGLQLCSMENSAERGRKRRADGSVEQGGGSGQAATTDIVAGSWVIPQKKARATLEVCNMNSSRGFGPMMITAEDLARTLEANDLILVGDGACFQVMDRQ